MKPLHLPWSIFWVGTALFVASAIGFGAVSRAVADWDSAFFAWKIGFTATAVQAGISALIWSRQRLSASYVYLAKSILCINLGGIFLAVGLPVFFVLPSGTPVGATLLVCIVLLIVAHATVAARHFRKQWDANGSGALKAAQKGKTLDIERFSKELRLAPPNIVQPGPPLLNIALPIIVVGMLLVGLSFRRVFPDLSAIAWGLSSFAGLTWLVQTALLFVLQARTISSTEVQLGHALLADER